MTTTTYSPARAADKSPVNASLLEWIAAAKVERRAYQTLRRAISLAPIRRGPDQYGQPWFGYVDRLRAEHATARTALDSVHVTPDVHLDGTDHF